MNEAFRPLGLSAFLLLVGPLGPVGPELPRPASPFPHIHFGVSAQETGPDASGRPVGVSPLGTVLDEPGGTALFANSDGLIRYRPGEDPEFVRLLSGVAVGPVVRDASGTLWAGTEHGRLRGAGGSRERDERIERR